MEEIDALSTVYLDVMRRYPAETHHLIVGDFNASCDYASTRQLSALKIRSSDFHWIVPDSADTNVNPGRACAYDRVVASDGLFDHYKGWEIGNWFTDKHISDHRPVWVTFKTTP